MTCASLENLQTIKDVTRDDAVLIRKIWHTVGPDALRAMLRRPVYNIAGRFDHACEQRGSTNIKQAAINVVIAACGVEYLGQRKGNREHVYYCNGGDTYSTTILFDGLHLRVGCIGDMVEKNLISSREF
jgi:hypothetical protein